jgi:hypothetical protein
VSGRRAFLALLVTGALGLGLSACSQAFVPADRDLAVVTINVQADGTATLRGLFGARDEAELQKIGDELAAAAFGEGSTTSVTIDGNGGSPFLVIHADGVYDTGSSPQVSFDIGKAALVIRKEGSTRGTLAVCFPDVGVSFETGVARTLTDGCLTSPIEGIPRGTTVEAVMHPSPLSYIVALVLLGVAIAAAWVAYKTFRTTTPWTKEARIKAIAAGGIGCLAALFSLGFLGSGPGMGVVGLVPGPALILVSAIPRLTPLLGVGCVVVIVLAADRKLDRVRAPVQEPVQV